jgi:cytosine/adenosine deaminase-related metal-dependent hydrolase
VGSLAPGKLADLSVFSLPRAPRAVTDNPYNSVLNGRNEVRDLMIGGKFIVKGGVILRERHAAAI